MARDRVLNVLLSVIALELLWIAAGQSWPAPVHAAAAATAQAPPASPITQPMPVVITGFRLDPSDPMLPVQVMGIVSVQQTTPIKVEADRPLPVAPISNRQTKYPGD